MKLPILISLILSCSVSYAQSRLSTTFALDYFSTTQNYAEDGSGTQPLPNGNSYSNLQMTFEGNYMPNKIYNFEAGLILARAESVTPALKRDQLNPTYVYGGIHPRLYKGSVEVWGIARGFYSVTPVDLSTTEVLIGEGDSGIDLGAELSKRFRRGEFKGSAFIHYPDQGRAVLLPFELSWAQRFTDWTFLRGRFFGVTGIVNDTYTNDKLQRRAVTDYVSAGSYRYYSINPQYFSVGADFVWLISPRAQTTVGVATTVQGKSAAAGTSLLASFTWSWGQSGERGTTEFIDRSGDRPKKNKDDFQIPEEKYDENLFKD